MVPTLKMLLVYSDNKLTEEVEVHKFFALQTDTNLNLKDTLKTLF
jgi:hypothetical protein